MAERRNRAAPKMTMDKLRHVLQVLKTVADPLSLDAEIAARSTTLQQACVIDAEEAYLQKSERGIIQQVLRKAFAALTPDEVEAVQQSFSLDLVNVPKHSRKTDLSTLLMPAMTKLRQSPEIQALRGKQISEIAAGQRSFPEQTARPGAPEEAVAVKKVKPAVNVPNREISAQVEKQAFSLYQQKLGSRGGMNRSQICFRLGITREELDRIINRHEDNGSRLSQLSF